MATPASVSAAFTPGEKFQARVQESLAPGIFKVQVGGYILQLPLPSNIRTGDTIALQVASRLPRLTFNMTASTNPLSNADQVSATARLLSSLTQQPLEKNYVRPINSAPLWAGNAAFPDPVELASQLRSALSHSGLFYESHQAQWLSGSRNTAQLLQEPQNLPAEKLNALLNRNSMPSPTDADATGNASDALSGQGRISINSIPEHLQQLVHQQLNALETRQVQWQGQIWPYQEMHWKISEEPSPSSSNEEGREWSTQIHLNLPNMGEVTATLRFGMNGLSITLDADKNITRAKLGADASKLVEALSERGINIASALVVQHDDA